MDKTQWIRCPVCGNKTRNRFRKDTILKKLSSLLSEMQTRNINRGKKICKYGLLTD